MKRGKVKEDVKEIGKEIKRKENKISGYFLLGICDPLYLLSCFPLRIWVLYSDI